jgi:hypothetical protein
MNPSHPKVILQRAGDPSPLAINHDKCLIRTVHNDRRIDCCAIFNGPHGAAIRSYTANVLVNGEPTSVKWLSVGDQIQLPCSTQIEVKAVQMQPNGTNRNTNFVAPEMLHSKNRSDKSPAVPQQDLTQVEPEEVFFSPLSPDLESAKTVDSQDANPGLDAEPAELDELESIFARLGLASDGSMPTPRSSNEKSVDGAESAIPVPEEEQADCVANIRKQIESANASGSDIPPIPQPTVANGVEPVVAETQLETSEETSMSENLAATNPEPVASIPAAVPTADMPAASPTLAPVAAPQPVAPQAGIPPKAVPQPTAPVASANDALSELPSDLRNQLNDLVSSLELEGADAPAEIPVPAPVVEATQSPAAPLEVPAVVPVTAVEPPARKAESVADVLVNMGIEVPGAQEMNVEPEAATALPESVATTTPEMGIPTSPVFANVNSAVETPALEAEAPTAPTPTPEPTATPNLQGSAAEDDIQAYMDRLLNRTTAPATASPASESSEEVPATAAVKPKQETVPAVLSAEEFVPSHKASRPENYDKLREIANSSSRNAVRNSSVKAKKQSFLLKVTVSLLALIGSLVTLCFGMTVPSCVLGIVGVVCALLSVVGRD